ncbi:hypothetical protein HBHAL_1373 [Halobacillus halophilus DSM 2266]|uniref:Uncharacterized protein n=1 Tax=Halobacillus halophilus (strain ATCC 35676 / DSM 2266 / JCM 20832 / KCTC 3685 / LMG 17431 / NBRC 102448 / NCIMB 2269) TaxID=866895 RepID=I0JHX7_HALH3|nr:hypothetical protein HBHAL_1373 [Halobacillus halophilus DSM 2266]
MKQLISRQNSLYKTNWGAVPSWGGRVVLLLFL